MTEITKDMLFAADVFSFLARQYSIVDCSLPLFSEHLNMKSDFTDDIGDAVLLLSYSYRYAFRKHILDVLPMISDSDNIPLYVNIFSYRTFPFHSTFKFLIICCFISELWLFRFFNNCFVDGMNEYVRPAMRCLRVVYKMILQKYYSPLFGWHELQQLASELAIGYRYLKPIIGMEHPFKLTRFLDSFTITRSESGTVFPLEMKTRKKETPVESSSDSETSFSTHSNLVPRDIKYNRTPTESSATSDASSSDSNGDSKKIFTENLRSSSVLPEDTSDNLMIIPNTTISQTSSATRDRCVPSSESKYIEFEPSQGEWAQDSSSRVDALPFGSVKESTNLVSRDICESATMYEAIYFDIRNDEILNALIVDKFEHDSAEDGSGTTESSLAGNANDLESSSEDSKSATVNGKPQSNRAWQRKKRTKRNKNVKKGNI